MKSAYGYTDLHSSSLFRSSSKYDMSVSSSYSQMKCDFSPSMKSPHFNESFHMHSFHWPPPLLLGSFCAHGFQSSAICTFSFFLFFLFQNQFFAGFPSFRGFAEAPNHQRKSEPPNSLRNWLISIRYGYGKEVVSWCRKCKLWQIKWPDGGDKLTLNVSTQDIKKKENKTGKMCI